MQPNSTSLIAGLKVSLYKQLMLLFTLLALVYVFLAFESFQTKVEDERRDSYRRFQTDMATIGQMVDQSYPILEADAQQALDQFQLYYKNTGGLGFDFKALGLGDDIDLYLFQGSAKNLIKSSNNLGNADLKSFLTDERLIKRMRLDERLLLPLGVMPSQNQNALCYGFLGISADKQYYVVVLKDVFSVTESYYNRFYEKATLDYQIQPAIDGPVANHYVANFQQGSSQSGDFFYHDFTTSDGLKHRVTALYLVPDSGQDLFLRDKVMLVGLLVFLVLMAQWLLMVLRLSLDVFYTVRIHLLGEDLSKRTVAFEQYPLTEMHALMISMKDVISNIERLLQDRQNQNDLLTQKSLEVSQQELALGIQHQKAMGVCEQLKWDLTKRKMKINQSIQSLMYAIELKEGIGQGHGERVRRYSEIIASRMRLSLVEIETIQYGALLHDIGKLSLTSQLNGGSGEAVEEIAELYKRHPELGGALLDGVSFADDVKSIVLQHHERLDGSGFPYGLAGDAIHPLARIVAVADAYDRMLQGKDVHAPMMNQHQIIEFLKEKAESQFDPQVVRVFIDYLMNEEPSA